MGINALKGSVEPTGKNAQGTKLVCSQEVSRANFKFVHALWSTGIEDQSIIWLAENIENRREKFFIKQSNKYKVYNHKRVQPLLLQLQLLGGMQGACKADLVCAFQDYDSLYLVCRAFEAFTLRDVLSHHSFSEDETKYVVMALLSVLEQVHLRGSAFVHLDPAHILVERTRGQIKLFQITNASPIRSNQYSCTVAQLCLYSAPEILVRSKVLAQSDFYSLGLIMYEMMTQRRAVQSLTRIQILRQTIEVAKSDLPEGWKPQAIDFLIKIIIKKPQLRLGRYGIAEVKEHPWLRNCNWPSHFSELKLTQVFFNSPPPPYKPNPTVNHLDQDQQSLREDFYFQNLFSTYQFVSLETNISSSSSSQKLQDEHFQDQNSSFRPHSKNSSQIYH